MYSRRKSHVCKHKLWLWSTRLFFLLFGYRNLKSTNTNCYIDPILWRDHLLLYWFKPQHTHIIFKCRCARRILKFALNLLKRFSSARFIRATRSLCSEFFFGADNLCDVLRLALKLSILIIRSQNDAVTTNHVHLVLGIETHCLSL